jgi:hypothetical protein
MDVCKGTHHFKNLQLRLRSPHLLVGFELLGNSSQLHPVSVALMKEQQGK